MMELKVNNKVRQIIEEMKKQIIYIVALVLMVSVFTGCGSKSADSSAEASHEEHSEGEAGHEGEEGNNEEGMAELHLSDMKFESLGIKLDTLPTRGLSGVVEANGQLEVPPQHEATVTAILGANVTSIKVIEGDQVSKGQVLAYLSHPNLTKLQTDYVRAYSPTTIFGKRKPTTEKVVRRRSRFRKNLSANTGGLPGHEG